MKSEKSKLQILNDYELNQFYIELDYIDWDVEHTSEDAPEFEELKNIQADLFAAICVYEGSKQS